MAPLTSQVWQALSTGDDLHPLHPTWQEISGGAGRLSDHVHLLRRRLRRKNSHLHIVTEHKAVAAGSRRAIVASYHLERSERISAQLDLNLEAKA